MTKAEKAAMTEMWNEISNDKSLCKQLFNIGMRGMSMCECGTYEAADMVAGRCLYRMSRSVVYINARKSHLHPRQLKTLTKLKELEKTEPDSTEKFENNWIATYYPNRPDALDDTCLYDVMRLYDLVKAGENEDALDMKNRAYGRLKLKNKPHLVSHPYQKYLEQKDDYCYSLLLMFEPFREESAELVDADSGSCIPIFERELLCNERMAEYHERLQRHEMRKAIEEEQQKPSQKTDDGEVNEDDDVNVLGLPLEAANAMQDLQQAMLLSGEDSLEANVAKMNMEQRSIFDHVTNHLEKGEGQLLLFISGAGGTGKSFLVNTVNLWARDFYGQQGSTAIVVAALTGLAAFNVNGVTLHRLFQLPVQHKRKTSYIELSDDACKEMRQNMKNLKLLVIDEVNMVSNEMLYMHSRLNQIFSAGEDKLYGGLNVIVMGDLMQLAPVAAKLAFCPMTTADVQKLTGASGPTDLWEERFENDELTISMCQKDDPAFTELLNRLRFGQISEEDVKVLKTRVVQVPPGVKPLWVFAEKYRSLLSTGNSVVCLVAKTSMVSQFNETMLAMEMK